MKIIIFYIYLVLFSSWILNLIHFPVEIGLLVLQFLDFIPLLYFVFCFKVRNSFRILPHTTVFWYILFAFIFLGLFTTLLHGGSLGALIAKMGVILRFMPFAAIIPVMKPGEDDVKLFITHLKIISLILVGIGMVEIIGGIEVYGYFAPLARENSTTMGMLARETAGDIFGIFSNTIDYAYFLIISYVILSATSYVKVAPVLLWSVFFVLIYFSGSKAAVIIFLFITSLYLAKSRYKRWMFGFWGVVLLVSGMLIYQYWELFYWTVFIDSQASRLGILMFTFPEFLSELSLDTFIGVSPDPGICYDKINSYSQVPMMLWGRDSMHTFDDEFYVAVTMYYGIIGLFFLLTLFIGMYRSLTKADYKNNIFEYKQMVKAAYVCLLIAPLFNQIIITKPFSLLFWVMIGMVCSQMQSSPPHHLSLN